MAASLRRKKVIGILSGLFLALGAVGCSERIGDVSGRVCYAGRPLPGGTIVLLASDGTPHHGQIGADGSFRIPDVSLGAARVAVSSLLEPAHSGEHATPVVPRRVKQPTAVYSRIPVHYGDLGRSGLSVTVAKDNNLELDLK